MTVEWDVHQTVDEYMPDKGVKGEIKYTAPYAFYVEFDTAYAKMPPYEPIREWVEREWNDLSRGLIEMAEESVGDDATDEELKKVVTIIIQKSIKKNGIDGVFFGRNAIEHGKQKAEMIANVHMERENPYESIARNLVEVMFEHSQGTIENEAKSSGDLKDSGEWDVWRIEE